MTLGQESRFFSQVTGGDYAKVVADAFDGAGGVVADVDLPWVLGALTFVGRTREAEGLFDSRRESLAPSQLVAARFFLAVALCREGRHDRSRQLFTANLVDARLGDDLTAQFFAAQGLAFFRYATGRLPAARLWAEAALKAASGATFTYGAVLALELLGHVQLSLGLIRAGLRTLDLARARAKALGQGALLQAMAVSVTLYRATYALAGSAEDVTRELETALATAHFEDSYTRASLHLELARVRILQGKLATAQTLLETASELVYRIDNPDLEIDHNICLASLLRRRGDTHQALSLVRGARHRARTRPDLRPLLRVLGLEAQLLGELGRAAEQAAMMPEIDRLTRKTSVWIGRRIQARASGAGGLQEEIRPGEDPLGDLLDASTLASSLTLPAIVRSGWLGLMPRAVGIAPQDRALVFDVEPGSLTIFSHGEVAHVSENCTDFMRKLIVALSAGEASKETLALHLWGRAYNPLRHDGLIYGLVAKTRKLLGNAGEWIEACEVGYRLRSGVRVVALSLSPRPVAEPELQAPVISSATPNAGLDARTLAALNIRQVSILDWLRAGEIVDPRSTMERLKISDATASRDLAGLVDLGLVARLGKGRATRYSLSAAGGKSRSPTGGAP